MHLCFVGAPLQLICLKEFLEKKKIHSYKIFLKISDIDHVNIQLEETIKILKLKNITRIFWKKNFFIQIIQRIYFILKLKSTYKNKKITIIASDFKNIFTHQLRLYFQEAKFIYIDDGAAVYFDFNNYYKKKYFFLIKILIIFLSFFSLIYFLGLI